MPLYQFTCGKCLKSVEVIAEMSSFMSRRPQCCGELMNLQFGTPKIKSGYPLWVDRMEDIHKAQEQRGERLRMIHPREVGAT